MESVFVNQFSVVVVAVYVAAVVFSVCLFCRLPLGGNYLPMESVLINQFSVLLSLFFAVGGSRSLATTTQPGALRLRFHCPRHKNGDGSTSSQKSSNNPAGRNGVETSLPVQ